MAVRTNGQDLIGSRMMNHILETGDTLLLLALHSFYDDWHGSFDFLLINEFRDKTEDVLKEHYFNLPWWFPYGNPKCNEPYSPKIIKIPGYYQYISLVCFLGVIIGAIAGIKLELLCIIAIWVLVATDITNVHKAIHVIDWKTIIIIAFSFSLGEAVKRSNLDKLVSHHINMLNTEGYILLLIIAFCHIIPCQCHNQQSSCSNYVSNCIRLIYR